MARAHRRFGRSGGGRLLPPALGEKWPGKRPELTGLWPVSLSFNIKQSHLVGRTERRGRSDWCGENSPDGTLAGWVRDRGGSGSGQGAFAHEVVAALLRAVVRGRNDLIRCRGRRGGCLAVALLAIAAGLFPAAGL